MHPQKMVPRALMLALLVSLVVSALNACSGGGGSAQKEVKPRPLPEYDTTLRPGEYRSEEFKPSLSFTVGKGWHNVTPQLPDKLAISPGGEPGKEPLLIFRNLQEVYKPAKGMGIPPVVEAPKDMVGWFQHHPHLDAEKPEPVTVGGVKGEQFDYVVAEDSPTSR